jgi:hypothetical protein
MNAFRGPFLECVSLSYEWSEACANCKFKDWAKMKCDLHNGEKPDRYRTTGEQAGLGLGLGEAEEDGASVTKVDENTEATDMPAEVEEVD